MQNPKTATMCKETRKRALAYTVIFVFVFANILSSFAPLIEAVQLPHNAKASELLWTAELGELSQVRPELLTSHLDELAAKAEQDEDLLTQIQAITGEDTAENALAKLAEVQKALTTAQGARMSAELIDQAQIILTKLAQAGLIDYVEDSEGTRTLANPELVEDGNTLTTKSTQYSLSASAEEAGHFQITNETDNGAVSVSYVPFLTEESETLMAENKVLHKNIWNNTDLLLTTTSEGVKEDLILKNENAPLEFAYGVALEGLMPRLTDEGALEFIDENDEVQMYIPAPTIYDANGQSGLAEYEILSLDKANLWLNAQSEDTEIANLRYDTETETWIYDMVDNTVQSLEVEDVQSFDELLEMADTLEEEIQSAEEPEEEDLVFVEEVEEEITEESTEEEIVEEAEEVIEEITEDIEPVVEEEEVVEEEVQAEPVVEEESIEPTEEVVEEVVEEVTEEVEEVTEPSLVEEIIEEVISVPEAQAQEQEEIIEEIITEENTDTTEPTEELTAEVEEEVITEEEILEEVAEEQVEESTEEVLEEGVVEEEETTEDIVEEEIVEEETVSLPTLPMNRDGYYIGKDGYYYKEGIAYDYRSSTYIYVREDWNVPSEDGTLPLSAYGELLTLMDEYQEEKVATEPKKIFPETYQFVLLVSIPEAVAEEMTYPLDLDPSTFVNFYARGNRLFATDNLSGGQAGLYTGASHFGYLSRGTEAVQTGGTRTLANALTSAVDASGNVHSASDVSSSEDWTADSNSLRSDTVGTKLLFTTATSTELWAGLTYGTAGGVLKVTIDKDTDDEIVNYIDTYNSSSLTEQKTLLATGLTNATHTIELELLETSNISRTGTGYRFSVDYVESYTTTNELLHASLISAATSAGTTTTIVDTALTGVDDVYIGQTVVILSGDDAGHIAYVTDSVQSTNTLTFTPELSTATTLGMTYKLLDGGILINDQALRGIEYTSSTTPSGAVYFASENIQSDAGSISTWIRPNFAYNSDANTHEIFTSEVAKLYYDGADDAFHFSIYDGADWSTTVASAEQDFSVDDVLHVAASWNNTAGLKLYINSVINSVSDTWTEQTVSGDIVIGGSTNIFDGVIAEVQVFDYALRAVEMADIYYATTPSINQSVEQYSSRVVESDEALLFNAVLSQTPNDTVGSLAGGAMLSDSVSGTQQNIGDMTGSGTEADPYVIYTCTQLQNISSSLSSYYELGDNIDCSATSTWNSNAGFAPLTTFTGHFDGKGYAVYDLYIYRPSSSYVGLFGQTSGATIQNVGVINADITALHVVGAVVGYLTSSSTVSGCYSTGSVTSTNTSGYVGVGGLVGQNYSSTIENSHSSVTVDGVDYVGGLVGYNYTNATITNSYAEGNVTGTSNYVGGLVGRSYSGSDIISSYATGDVDGASYAGGLVGQSDYSSATIDDSYATGDVSGTQYVGGLVGYNYSSAIITDSYAEGNVTGSGVYVGGLVGYNNSSSISGAHATGNVTNTSASQYTGGLVGYNYSSSASISDSYATGDVESQGAYVGGLVGGSGSSASISNVYATGDVSGTSTDISSVGGLVGYNYGSASISNAYATGDVTGYNVTGGLVGYNYNSATINNSYSAGNVTRTNNSSYYGVGGLIGQNQSATITNSYSVSNVTAPSGHSSYAGSFGYIYSGTLTNSYYWSGSTCTNCGYTSGTAEATLANFYDSTHDVYDSNSPYWSFSNPWNEWSSELPRFTEEPATSMSGSGTEVDPYVIYTCTQLQSMSSSLSSYYELGNDINCAISKTWNSGSGFDPIGTNVTQFTGQLDGKGYVISNLYISRAGTNFIGLFGYTNSGALIQNVGLENVNIAGYYTGALVGTNQSSTIDNCYATGTITNTSGASGGLVANNNNSTISDSYADCTITSTSDYTGGLAGMSHADSTISNSYSEGDVEGTSYVGGLVGYHNASTIEDSHSTATVEGTGNNTGGLVGSNESSSSISDSYATGDVTGSANSVGGFVGNNYSSSIASSYATGDVTVTSSDSNAGGFVGSNNSSSTITDSYATGDVVTSNINSVGGFAGGNYSSSSITNSYSVGNVTGGNNQVGGFVGRNYTSSTITNSYSVGNVNQTNSSYSSTTGRLIGYQNATLTNSYYWSGSTCTNCGATNGTAETTLANFYDSTHDVYDSTSPYWDFTNIWTEYSNALPDFGTAVSSTGGQTFSDSSFLTTVVSTPASTTEIVLGTDMGSDKGIIRVIVDGGTPQQVITEVDTYSATTQSDKRFLIATGLDAGVHTVRVKRTGTANPASTGVEVEPQFIESLTTSSITTTSLDINGRLVDDVITQESSTLPNGITYPDKGNISETIHEGTVEFWATSGTLTASKTLLDTRNASTYNGLAITTDSSSNLVFTFANASSSVSTTAAGSGNYSSTQANHILARWYTSGTDLTMSLYLNGTKIAENTNTFTPSSHSRIYLPASSTALYDFAIYSKAFEDGGASVSSTVDSDSEVGQAYATLGHTTDHITEIEVGDLTLNTSGVYYAEQGAISNANIYVNGQQADITTTKAGSYALLNGSLTSTTTSISIDNIDDESAIRTTGGVAYIGSAQSAIREKIYYGSYASGTFSDVVRGIDGTSASAWSDNSIIEVVGVIIPTDTPSESASIHLDYDYLASANERSHASREMSTMTFLDKDSSASTGWLAGQSSVAGQTLFGLIRGSSVSVVYTGSTTDGAEMQFILDEGTANERRTVVDMSTANGAQIKLLNSDLGEGVHTVRGVVLSGTARSLGLVANGHMTVLYDSGNLDIVAADLLQNMLLNQLLSGSVAVNGIRFYDSAQEDTDDSWREDTSTSWYAEAGLYPEKSYIIVSDSALFIFDASNNLPWMTFVVNEGSAIDSPINDIAVQEGVIYVATDTGLVKLDFANDEITKLIEQETYYSGWYDFIDRNASDFAYNNAPETTDEEITAVSVEGNTLAIGTNNTTTASNSNLYIYDTETGLIDQTNSAGAIINTVYVSSTESVYYATDNKIVKTSNGTGETTNSSLGANTLISDGKFIFAGTDSGVAKLSLSDVSTLDATYISQTGGTHNILSDGTNVVTVLEYDANNSRLLVGTNDGTEGNGAVSVITGLDDDPYLISDYSVGSNGLGSTQILALDSAMVQAADVSDTMTGSGTEDDPYIIYNCTQLQEMSDSLSSYYELANNINCSATSSWNSGSGFAPISTFTGHFDGKGHKIFNLYISRSSTSTVGLFGHISGATIQNVGLENVNITGNTNTGGLVGSAISTSIISNAYVSGGTITNASNYTGGLVGQAVSTTISDSYANATISGASYTGGFIGYANGTVTITDSYALGNVTATGNYSGGFAGYNNNSSKIYRSYATGNVNASAIQAGGFVGTSVSATIEDCYATGDVTNTTQHTGGFIGVHQQATIRNCYATGDVTGTTTVGGFVAHQQIGAYTYNSYSTGNVTGSSSYVGGFVGHNYNYSSASYIYNSFSTGDVTNTSTSYTANTGRFAGYNGVTITNSYYWSGSACTNCGYVVGTAESDITNFYDSTHDVYDTTTPYWEFGSIWNENASAFPTLTGYNLGSGTADDPYMIYTCDALQDMNNSLSSYYELGDDIDCSATSTWNSGSGFDPIGQSSPYFTGSFNGNGHTISDLYVSRSSESYVGLFGYASGATIQNVGLTDVDITGYNYSGGLVGYNYNSSIVSNSYSTGTVESVSSSYTGGLVGRNYTSTILNSYSTADVTGVSESVGGLSGCSESNSIIKKSYATGDVTSTGSYVGGLVGYNSQSDIYDSYFTGTVNASGTYVGGIAGQNTYNSTLTNSYSTGAVTGSSQVGGLVGYNSQSIITNAYATGDVTGSSNVALLVGGQNATLTNSYYYSGATCTTCTTSNGTAESDMTAFYDATHNVYDSTDPYWDFAGTWLENTTDFPSLLHYTPGSGTEDDPYMIYSCPQLQDMADDLSASYKLANDIDCSSTTSWNSGAGFTPVGSSSTPFTGTFDGNGKTISDLYIYLPSNNYVALFSYTSGSDIHDVGLIDADVTGSGYVGTLIGWHTTSSTLSRSYATGTITSSGSNGAGGLVDYNNGSVITDCWADVDITGNDGSTGGLAGVNYGSAAYIYDSYALGDVDSNSTYLGGLVGANYTSAHTINCYSTGNVDGPGGGQNGLLIGYQAATVTNSYYWSGATCTSCGSTSGTAVSDITDFYDATHDVYDSTTPYWNFTQTWYENESTFPTLLSPGTSNVGAYDLYIVLVGTMSGFDLVEFENMVSPNQPVVTDDGSTTSTASTLHASWSVTGGTAITEYQYCVSSNSVSCGTGQIRGWTSVGTDTEVTDTSLALITDTTYYFHVKGKNENDLWSSVGHSDGITVTVLDVSPDAPTLVSPSSGSYITDTTPDLSAHYSDDNADDTGTTSYRIATTSAGCLDDSTVVRSGASSETSTNDEDTTWTVASEITSDGTYYWCAQNNDGTNTSAWTSMGSFTLDTIDPTIATDTLTAPNGSEEWAHSTEQTITWDNTDITDTNLGSTPIMLEYSTNSGSSWNTITTATENDGSYAWTPPAVTSTQVQVRITVTDLAGHTDSDTSDADFSLIDAVADTTEITGGDNQLGGIGDDVSALQVRIGNGSGYYVGENDVAVTYTISTTPSTPTASGQELSFTTGSTCGGSSTTQTSGNSITVYTDSDGYACADFQLGDRAGVYEITASFDDGTGDKTQTFTVIEREELIFDFDASTMELLNNPNSGSADEGRVTISFETNASAYDIVATPSQWLTHSGDATRKIDNWDGTDGFAWDNNSDTTTPTAFSVDGDNPDATTIYSCSGDSCQGPQTIEIDLHTVVGYDIRSGTYNLNLPLSLTNVTF